MSLFRVFFVPLPFSLCTEGTSYVISFRLMFFYLVTTGWIFYIFSAYVRIQSINPDPKVSLPIALCTHFCTTRQARQWNRLKCRWRWRYTVRFQRSARVTSDYLVAMSGDPAIREFAYTRHDILSDTTVHR